MCDEVWDEFRPSWATAQLTLNDWRGRIERVAEQEGEYFRGIPFIRGLAVIGSVGRSDPWPCSDIDLLTVVSDPGDSDIGPLVEAEERKHNAALYAARIPNTVELIHWILLGRAIGENLPELAAKRDLVTNLLYQADRCRWPAWTGVTQDRAIVERQLQAFEALVKRLEREVPIL